MVECLRHISEICCSFFPLVGESQGTREEGMSYSLSNHCLRGRGTYLNDEKQSREGTVLYNHMTHALAKS